MTKEEIKYKLEHFTFGNKLWNEFAPYRNNEIPQKVDAKNAAVALHIKVLKSKFKLFLLSVPNIQECTVNKLPFLEVKKTLMI